MVVLHILLALWGITTGSSTIVVIGVAARRRSGFLRGNGTRRRLLSWLASISLNYERLLFLTGGYLRLYKYEH